MTRRKRRAPSDRKRYDEFFGLDRIKKLPVNFIEVDAPEGAAATQSIRVSPRSRGTFNITGEFSKDNPPPHYTVNIDKPFDDYPAEYSAVNMGSPIKIHCRNPRCQPWRHADFMFVRKVAENTALRCCDAWDSASSWEEPPPVKWWIEG